MTRGRFRWIVFSLWAGALFIASGCAVLTVDVDVYKGPLANDPDVQVHQVAVTALAARPLLARLRYELEMRARAWRYIKRTVKGEFCEADADIKLRTSQDFVVPTDRQTRDICQFNFLSRQAALVNDILALYGFVGENHYVSPFTPERANSRAWNASTQPTTAGMADEPGPEISVGLTEFLGQSRSLAPRSIPNCLTEAEYHQLWVLERMRFADDPNALDVSIARFMSQKEVWKQKKQEARIERLDPEKPEPEEKQEYVRRQTELFDRLVQFSQQVLFVANQDVLFRDTAGITQNAFDISHNVLAGGLDGYAIDHAYVRMLQAVGNSIMVNVDELRERGDFDDVQQRLAVSESAALTSQYRASPAIVLTDLAEAIDNQIRPLAKSVADRSAESATTKRVTTKPATTQSATSQATTNPSPTGDAAKKSDEVTAANKEMNAAAQKLTEDKATLLRLQHTQAALNEAMPTVLAPRDPPEEHAPSASVVYDRLRAAITEAKAKATGESVAKYSDALDELNSRIPPEEMIALGGESATKEVMDKLIATYRYAYLEAVKERGEDDETAKNLKAALADAEDQRSNMIYIRPASSYLRSSTPSSSLQRDARLGWKNMLLEQYTHQIPFAADITSNGNAKDYETVLELDKQYWQNVNTIRVAGGGNTNYVVAKDDIGNWYVKNVSTDPKDIIHSAMSLAMFAAGPELGGADLVAKVAQQQAAGNIAAGAKPSDEAKKLNDLADATKSGTSAGQGSAAQSSSPPIALTPAQTGQFQSATSRYDRSAQAQAKALTSFLEALPDKASSAIPSNRADLQSSARSSVKDAVASALAELQSGSASVDERAAGINDGLRAMLSACDAFKATVNGSVTPPDDQPIIEGFCKPLLAKVDVSTQQWKRAVDRYQADLKSLPSTDTTVPASQKPTTRPSGSEG